MSILKHIFVFSIILVSVLNENEPVEESTNGKDSEFEEEHVEETYTETTEKYKVNYGTIESFKTVFRIISFEFFGFKILNNKLKNGSCCDNQENPTNLKCSSCKNEFILICDGCEDTIMKIKIFQTKNTDLSVYCYEKHLIYVRENEKLKLLIQHSTVDSNGIYDEWNGPMGNNFGTFLMNGVHGFRKNTIIFARFDVFNPDPITPLTSFFFYFTEIQWLHHKHSDEELLFVACPNSCLFQIAVSISGTTIWKSSLIQHHLNDSKYFLKEGGSTNAIIAFNDRVNLDINIYNVELYQLIDTFSIKKIKLMPNKVKEYDNFSGSYGNILLNFVIRFDCVGRSGINCMFDCRNENGLRGCRNDYETIFCLNGSPDTLNCNKTGDTCKISPCENNGTCIALPKGHLCKCKTGYIGRYCQTSKCEYECYSGICQDNMCQCHSGYIGERCDLLPCSEDESRDCHSLSDCLKTRDIAKCICKDFAAGENCTIPVCHPGCHGGKCVWNKVPTINYPVECKCKSMYKGNFCEISKTDDHSYRVFYNCLFLSMLCILLLILLKISVYIIVTNSLLIQILSGIDSSVPQGYI